MKIYLCGNTQITDEFYVVTEETLQNWGLNKIELSNNEKYVIQFKDIIKEENKEISVEVYNTIGYKGNYSLTDIENIEE